MTDTIKRANRVFTRAIPTRLTWTLINIYGRKNTCCKHLYRQIALVKYSTSNEEKVWFRVLMTCHIRAHCMNTASRGLLNTGHNGVDMMEIKEVLPTHILWFNVAVKPVWHTHLYPPGMSTQSPWRHTLGVSTHSLRSFWRYRNERLKSLGFIT